MFHFLPLYISAVFILFITEQEDTFCLVHVHGKKNFNAHYYNSASAKFTSMHDGLAPNVPGLSFTPPPIFVKSARWFLRFHLLNGSAPKT